MIINFITSIMSIISEATGDVHHGSSAGGVTPLPTCDGDIFTTSAISHMIQERGDIKGFNANMQ